MVYCAPNLAKVKSLIKVALKKLPKGTRLVVVCKEYSDDDYSDALEMGYCLVTMGTLRQYGSQMLEISSGSDSLPQTA